MDFSLLNAVVPLEPLLGYLNFSEGKPDPRFQKQFNEAYAWLAEHGSATPWTELHSALQARLAELHASGASAFRSKEQAEGVLRLVFAGVLPAYREHHADLLFHLSDAELCQPFFLVRVVEAVLSQGGPWNDDERIVAGAVATLNDFVGHRPVAILETRPRGEPYEHERVRPIPLYLRGAGCAWGRYRELLEQALVVLRDTDPAILQDASFDMELLDELALDPRAYDHTHPVNRRSNYIFGEWDPHHLDLQGRYRRFVVRQVTLDALLDRSENTTDVPRGEVLFEAAATLAGTILMASGISGGSPATHDSTTTLTSLIPRVARYRDAFYEALLGKLPGSHAQRLRDEAARTKQPFGAARQRLNQSLGRHRAAQLQRQHLAIIFAAMGYPEASRAQAAQIPAASIRMLSEIQIRLTTARLAIDRGDVSSAAALLPEVEDLVHRGIAAGALADPWNILGFQALFPLSQAQEDSVRDHRLDALINVVAELFGLYDRILCEAASRGNSELVKNLTPPMRRLAGWWDRFASVEVSDVRHVHGAAAADSAIHVAKALAQWHAKGESTADLAFWRDQQESFRSPQAYARVIDALLRSEDYRAAMALLVTWLGQAEQVPLEEGEYSFHQLALRWLLGLVSVEASARRGEPSARRGEPSARRGEPSARRGEPSARRDGGPNASWPLITKLLDYLEANAEEFWQVPRLGIADATQARDTKDSLFEAAYEGVTYQDSTDDDQEGAVADGSSYRADFTLEPEAPRLEKRLAFLATVARLWHIATQSRAGQPAPELAAWLASARANHRQLLALLDAIQACPVSEPAGSFDALVAYDAQRQVKERLLDRTIDTCLDALRAGSTLQGTLGETPAGGDVPAWSNAAARLERAILAGDSAAARSVLPEFLDGFRTEPLLFKALFAGGEPRQILRARNAVQILSALVAALPRLGLLTETYQLLLTARQMEDGQPPEDRGVTQFNALFEIGFRAMAEAVIDSGAFEGQELSHALERLTGPCLIVWVEHSRKVQVSVLESLPVTQPSPPAGEGRVRGTESAWAELRSFVKRYGADLFHHRFMAPGNLRGILHQGAGAYLDYLRDNPDPLHPVALIEDLDRAIPRDRTIQFLEFVLRAVLDNYAEFKDYHQTATQSAYGENLYMLLDFLNLKASYERHLWTMRPLALVHDVLVRTSRADAAIYWRDRCAEHQRAAADEHLRQLSSLEQAYGMRLPTISDRLHERFVKPLDLNRLCGLIAPAMKEASQTEQPHFQRLQTEIDSFAAQPTGVGLDVPHWLLRLQMEVQHVRMRQSSLAVLAESWVQVPRRRLTREEIEGQVREIQAAGEPRASARGREPHS